MFTLITAATTTRAHQLKHKINIPEIILGDYLELPSFMLRAESMIKLPDPKSIAYAHEMLTLCLDKNITTIYILREEERELLTEAAQLFSEFDIKMIFSE